MKKREMNFELMRILSMLMIVFWHVVCMNGRADSNALINHTTGLTNWLLNVMYILAIVHVNSFVIISGYFNYNKEFSKKQFFKVFNASWFYRTLFAVVFCFLGLETLGSISFFKQAFPLDITYNYWYINCYLLLYLLTPFLNLFIKHATQDIHRKYLIVSFIIFCIVPSITGQTTVSTNGFNIVNFCMLYLLGAYLKKYPLTENIHFKNFSQKKIRNISIALFFCCGFTNIMLDQYAISLIDAGSGFLNFIGNILSSFVCNYNNPIVVIQSAAYFIFFSTLKIKNKLLNQTIQSIAPLTLGVYLIHFNAYVREYLYKWLGLYNVDYIYPKEIIIKVIISVFLIFIVCIFIEKIRQVTINSISKIYNKKIKVDKNNI